MPQSGSRQAALLRPELPLAVCVWSHVWARLSGVPFGALGRCPPEPLSGLPSSGMGLHAVR